MGLINTSSANNQPDINLVSNYYVILIEGSNYIKQFNQVLTSTSIHGTWGKPNASSQIILTNLILHPSHQNFALR